MAAIIQGGVRLTGVTIGAESLPPTGFMSMTYDTSLNSNAPVTIPLTGAVSAIINWGDGNTEPATMAGDYTHQYLTPGTYIATISGTIDGIGGTSLPTSNPALVSVNSWNDLLGLTSASYAFANAPNLTSVPSNLPYGIITIDGLFRNSTSFDSSAVGTWDMSYVLSMSNIFNGATLFNQDLTSWCVYLVTGTPLDFSTGSALTGPNSPVWGTCPARPPMQLVYDTTLGTKTITVPLHSTVNATINWGDGILETVTAAATHTYAVDGTYNVSVTGYVDGYGATGVNGPELTQMTSWGTLDLTDVSFAFADATNLTVVPADIPYYVTNVSSMFKGATSFNYYINAWNTINITDMSSMFEGATLFNQPLNWDVSAVINLSSMFKNAIAFNGDISQWASVMATSMNSMFQNATSFNRDLSTWSVSNVTDMDYMFNNATSFDSDPDMIGRGLYGWCVSNISVLPAGFATSAPLTAPNYPMWGTCPS